MNKTGYYAVIVAREMFGSCDAACDPPAATPDVDLTAQLTASLHCCTCGDPIKSDDPDNFKRPAGYNKAGRTDCGTCVRGMRRNCD